MENHKLIQMKKILLSVLFLCSGIANGQYASTIFVTLNDGMEQAYLDIEMLWQAYHEETVKQGLKSGWSVWKIDPAGYDDKIEASRTPDYLIIESYATMEAMEKQNASYTTEGIEAIVNTIKRKFRGKISSRKIDRMLAKDVNKERRTYVHQMLAQTPFTGGDLKPGEKMVLAPMQQLQDDYEQYETAFYQKVFADNVMKGNHRWWGFTKIIDRSENAINNTTHAAWNIGIEGKSMDMPQDFASQKIFEITSEARKMYNPITLELVYTVQ